MSGQSIIYATAFETAELPVPSLECLKKTVEKGYLLKAFTYPFDFIVGDFFEEIQFFNRQLSSERHQLYQR